MGALQTSSSTSLSQRPELQVALCKGSEHGPVKDTGFEWPCAVPGTFWRRSLVPGNAAGDKVLSEHGLVPINSAGAAALDKWCMLEKGGNEKSHFVAAVYIV